MSSKGIILSNNIKAKKDNPIFGKMQFLKHQKVTLISFVLILGTLAILSFGFPKLEMHKAINTKANQELDYVFFMLTKLAEGWFTFPLLIIFIWKNRPYLWRVGTAYGLSAIVAQFLKRQVFTEHMRPAHYFRSDPDFYFTELVSHYVSMSFPSGHTTTAFTIFGMLSYLSFRPNWKVGYLVLASIVGFSRVYLSMHFLEDVLGGAVLGFVISTIVYLIFKKFGKNVANSEL